MGPIVKGILMSTTWQLILLSFNPGQDLLQCLRVNNISKHETTDDCDRSANHALLSPYVAILYTAPSRGVVM